jgi:hypothetical protein
MANRITVELTAQDAEMVAAWQRQRDNVGAFAARIEEANAKTRDAHKHSQEWLGGVQDGLDHSIKDMAKFATSFTLVEKGLDGIIEKYREWAKEIEEVAEKLEQQQQKVGEQLTLQGRMKEAPEILEKVKEVHALDSEKTAVMEGLTRANPKLTKDQIVGLEKQLAPQGEIYGPENLKTIGGIAGKLQGVDDKKSAAQIADLTLFAAQHTEGRFGELADPAAQRTMQLLKNKAGFSTEKALAFEVTGIQHEMTGRQLETVAQSLTKQEDLAQLAHHANRSPEHAAKFRFYSEKSADKRLNMLLTDPATREAVLAGNGERMSGMNPDEIGKNTQALTAAEQSGLARQNLADWAAQNPTLHETHVGKVKGEIKGKLVAEAAGIPELLAKQRAEDEAGKFDNPVEKSARDIRHAGERDARVSAFLHPGMRHMAWKVHDTLFGEPSEDVKKRRGWEQQWRDKIGGFDQEFDQQEAAESSGVAPAAGAPAAGAPRSAVGGSNDAALLDEQRKQTALLQQIVAKDHSPQVAVNVHGGSGGGRRDHSTRSDYSPSSVLGHGGHGGGGESGTL